MTQRNVTKRYMQGPKAWCHGMVRDKQSFHFAYLVSLGTRCHETLRTDDTVTRGIYVPRTFPHSFLLAIFLYITVRDVKDVESDGMY